MASVAQKGKDPGKVEAGEEVSRSEFRLQAGCESGVRAWAGVTPPEGGTPNSRVNAELRTAGGTGS
jgi:hypothetical protein